MGNLRSSPKVRIFWKKLATQVDYGNSGRLDRERPAQVIAIKKNKLANKSKFIFLFYHKNQRDFLALVY